MNLTNTIEVISPVVVSLSDLPEYLRLNNAHVHNKKCRLGDDNLKLCIVCLEPRESSYFDEDDPDAVEPYDCPRCEQFYCAPCREQFESIESDCPTCKCDVTRITSNDPVPIVYIDRDDEAEPCDCKCNCGPVSGVIMLRPKMVVIDSDEFKDCLQANAKFTHRRQCHTDWWDYRHDSEFCIVCHEYLFTDTPDIDCGMCPCSLSYCIGCITKLGVDPDDLPNEDHCPACNIGVVSVDQCYYN
jgi:hypothetical protein